MSTDDCETPFWLVAVGAVVFAGMHVFAGYATENILGSTNVPMDESTEEEAKRRTCRAVSSGTTAVVVALVILSLLSVGRVCLRRA